jgi:hypothetical protein
MKCTSVVSDWLDAGHTREDLTGMAGRPPWDSRVFAAAQARQWSKSLEALDRLRAVGGRDLHCHTEPARALHALGRHAEAAVEVTSALKLEPNSAAVLMLATGGRYLGIPRKGDFGAPRSEREDVTRSQLRCTQCPGNRVRYTLVFTQTSPRSCWGVACA